jgi:hypothetical protein
VSNRFKRTVLAVLLLALGIVWQTIARTPPIELGPVTIIKLDRSGKLDPEFVRQRMDFIKKNMEYVKALPPPYSDYPNAFTIARSEADYPRIKEAIDRETAINDAISDAGLGAVPGLTTAELTRPSLWLIALAAAVAFRAFAFVIGGAFLAGLLRGAGMEMGTLTGITAEHYLASILAALIVAALAWFLLQRFWRAPPA